jgi:molecular chaperone GrpE
MKKKEEQKNEKHDEHVKHEKSKKSLDREADIKKDFEDLKDTLQRTHADFQNYRKRSEEEKSRFIKLSNEQLIKKILPVLDNFELALKHNTEDNEFSKGMALIYDQLLEVLLEEGLEKINATGKFNPNFHEAVMVEETEKEQGIILEELQKGYKIGDRVLRSSKVKISKQKKSNEEVNKNE